MVSEKLKTVDTYLAGKDSIIKALDFLKPEKCVNKRYLKKGKDVYEKRVGNCTTSIKLKKNKNSNSTVFSGNFVTLQMRSCLMEHDWISLQRLIPLLLDYSVDREPILWRFALITFLNSPESYENLILNFLEKCLGSTSEIESDQPERHLQQLLTMESFEYNIEQIWITEMEYTKH